MANFWRKAKEALKVAEWDYQNGQYNEAVCRSYFAALKASLALMASLGLKPKETVRIGHWVQAHFAIERIHRRKLTPAESGRWLTDLSNLRSRAEYTRIR
ncbi:MAG: HEPN domain-containing protein [Armatimonadetes bacterium]|nr:HEPN domain-containing protein [Armatimonadota bacterium]